MLVDSTRVVILLSLFLQHQITFDKKLTKRKKRNKKLLPICWHITCHRVVDGGCTVAPLPRPGMMGACVETYKYDGRGTTRLSKARFYADFWQWTDYADYLTFVALFTVGFGLLTFMCLNVQLYVDTLGFMVSSLLLSVQGGVPLARR